VSDRWPGWPAEQPTPAGKLAGSVPPPALSFDPAREEAELREYLGERFDIERLRGSHEVLEAEFAAVGDEERFYRTSTAYLYNLTSFAMTATKLPYLRELLRHLPPGARVLDYGCGIGSDGLMLLEAGYRVEFADFHNPSAEYLRWRLRHRGLDAPVHDIDRAVPEGFDAAYAFDVIEHVPDPFAFLAELERRATLVEVNFLAPVPWDQELHHELPVAELLTHVAAFRLRGYRLMYGRSHLVLYEPWPASWFGRVSARARIGSGKLGARLSAAGGRR
jgi:SAM-dependent methyltransferase